MDCNALAYKKEKAVYECTDSPFSKADGNWSDWTCQVQTDKGYQKASGCLYKHQKTPNWLTIRRAPQVLHSASASVRVLTAPLFAIIPTRFCSFTPSSGGGRHGIQNV